MVVPNFQFFTINASNLTYVDISLKVAYEATIPEYRAFVLQAVDLMAEDPRLSSWRRLATLSALRVRLKLNDPESLRERQEAVRALSSALETASRSILELELGVEQ